MVSFTVLNAALGDKGLCVCVCVTVCVCVWGGGGGGGGAGGQVFVFLIHGHEFESHHSQMNIDHSSFLPPSTPTMESTQL